MDATNPVPQDPFKTDEVVVLDGHDLRNSNDVAALRGQHPRNSSDAAASGAGVT